MDEKVLEIGCHLLQAEYLERQGLGEKTFEELANLPGIFPTTWQSYLYEDRVEILQQALKDNVDLDTVIESKRNIKIPKQK